MAPIDRSETRPLHTRSASYTYAFAGRRLLSDIHLPELAPVEAHSSDAARLRLTDSSLEEFGDRRTLISAWPASEGGMKLYGVGPGEALLLEFPRLAEAVWQGFDVYIQAHAGTDAATIRHLILDQIMPRVLSHQGQTVLHASVVRIGGEAVAFTGRSGSGKSTLAAYLATEGLEFLADDAAVVTSTAGLDAPLAVPTYPGLRLWPDSLTHLYSATEPVISLALYSAKKRITRRTASVEQPHPLKAIYVLSAAASENIAVRRQSPMESCATIIANSFRSNVCDQSLARLHLAHAGEIAAAVPVYELMYPRRYTVLPELKKTLFCQERTAN